MRGRERQREPELDRLQLVRVRKGQHGVDCLNSQRVEPLLEHADLEGIDQRAGAEQPHEPEDPHHDQGQKRQSLERVHGPKTQPHAEPRLGRLPQSVGFGEDLVSAIQSHLIALVILPELPAVEAIHAGLAGPRQRLDHAVDTGVLNRHGADDRDPQDFAQSVDVDAGPAAPKLIHHVENKNDRATQLGELESQEKGPAQVLGVRHLH